MRSSAGPGGLTAPLVAAALALAAGIVIDRLAPFPAAIWVASAALALGVAAATSRTNGAAARVGLVLGFVAIGGALHATRARRALPADHILRHADAQAERPVRFEGVARSEPRPADGGVWRLVIDVVRAASAGRLLPASGGVRVSLNGAPSEPVLPGDAVALRARVRAATGFRGPGTVDRRRRLASRGIEALAWLEDPAGLVVLGPEEPRPLARALARRAGLVRGLLDDAAAAEGDGRALIGALALGEGAAMPRDLREAFDRTGTSHLLAVSGLHLGLVVALALLLLQWLVGRSEWLLLRTDAPALAALAAIPIAWAYAGLTGASLPTVRAAVMATCFLGAIALGRRGAWPSALSLAALALLAHRPGALFAPSFQLSFVAVAAVAAGTPVLLARLPTPGNRAAGYMLTLACASLAASLATAPIAAVHFLRAAPAGPLANLLLVPPVALALVPLGVALAVLAPWPAVAAPLAGAATTIAGGVAWLARGLAELPVGAGAVPPPNGFEITLWYTTLFAAGLALSAPHRWRASRVAAACALALAADVVWWSGAVGGPAAEMQIGFLDVAQGDAALIQMPDGATILIDVGGVADDRPDPGDLAVVPALLVARARRVDLVVISHPHRDHCGGLGAVLATFPVREIWTNGDEGDPGCAAHLAEARRRGAKVRDVGAGEPPRRFGDAILEVLHPGPDAPEGLNDRSLTVRARLGEVSILFPGDIEAAGEDHLVAGGASLASTVLKVPHHGSPTSSTAGFLDAVGMKEAVVSVGRGNRFGFPGPGVLSRLRRAGARVHRTDAHGAVYMRTTGTDLEVATDPSWR